MNKDLFSLINEKLSSFSKGHKLIANYMVAHYDKAAFMTAQKLGKTVGVSESTVVRFATMLGYDGYPALQKALQEVDAGHIGNYDSCLSYSRVTGTWRPLEGTHPYIGSEGEISEEPEFKVEVTIKADALAETVEKIKQVHPYEEPVINIIPLIVSKADPVLEA